MWSGWPYPLNHTHLSKGHAEGSSSSSAYSSASSRSPEMASLCLAGKVSLRAPWLGAAGARHGRQTLRDTWVFRPPSPLPPSLPPSAALRAASTATAKIKKQGWPLSPQVAAVSAPGSHRVLDERGDGSQRRPSGGGLWRVPTRAGRLCTALSHAGQQGLPGGAHDRPALRVCAR